MWRGKDIIIISPIDWDFLRQRHQIFAAFFAGQGNNVFYVENLNPTMKLNGISFGKISRRITKTVRNQPRQARELNRISVITPALAPLLNPAARWINKIFFLRRLASRLRASGVKNPVVWTYLATSEAVELIRLLRPAAVIYDCVYDAVRHPYSPGDIRDSEQDLLDRADLILTDNSLLYTRCSAVNPRTFLLTPGVDMKRFDNASMPVEGLDDIPAPRLCFFGGIDSIRLDLELIRSIAVARPRWNIILYGPVVKTDISRLKLDNIFFKAAVAYEKLPSYLQQMDVLILPYKICPFTQSVFPAKTFECLASGRPIVATPLPELRAFDAGIIRTAPAGRFVEAIEYTLQNDTGRLRQQRIRLARINSWDERFRALNDILNTQGVT